MKDRLLTVVVSVITTVVTFLLTDVVSGQSLTKAQETVSGARNGVGV